MAGLKTAAAYIRVSTEDQIEYSPDAQLAEIRKYAAREGYILPKEYIYMDEGISGRSTKKRSAFNELIGTAKLKPKPFDAILLWKFSRFARSREDSVVYKSMLRKQLGIEVISISEPVGDDKMSVLIEAMIEAMDEYYSINLAEEVKRGMTEKARRGGLQSSPPFGYRAVDNTLIPEPSEAALVREIFSRFIAGDGTFSISKWLNSIGAVTHRGNAFENRTVEYILQNPAYIGKLRWNPTGRTRRNFTDPNLIIADGGHEPIVAAEEWDAAQQRMDAAKARRKKNSRPSTELKDWLSGIVRCASCGSTLVFVRPNYFKCGRYIRGACPDSQHITADALHQAFISRIQRDCIGSALLTPVIKHTEHSSAHRISALESRLESLQKKSQRVREAYLGGVDTLEEYREHKQLIDGQIQELQNRIDGLKTPEPQENPDAAVRSAIAEALSAMTPDTASREEKHNAADAVVENCTWDKSRNLLQITYRPIF